MRRTSFILIPIATVLLAGPVPAQDEIPRTPDGRPDFSGTYDIATLTPLVRPSQFGDRLFLSREEAEAIAAQERELLAKGSEVSDPNRDAPPEGGAPPVGLDQSFLESSGAGSVGGYNNFWIDRGEGAFEIDGKFRTSIIEDPANGQFPPFTAQGQARIGRLLAAYARPNDGTAWWVGRDGPGPYDDPESLTLADRCLLGFGSTAGPPMLPVLYNNHKRIVQTADHVMILNEMVHDARIVPLGGEHGPEDVRRWLGSSVGRWEGDTLVIETVNFRDETGMFAASRDLRVTERLSYLEAGRLLYEFTVEDPSTWKGSWTGSYVWPATDNRVYEYACHEGNYAMKGILRGARLLEREALEAAGSDSDD